MWTIAAANKKLNGPLGSYNGLTDIHLAHYFSSPAKLSHLKDAKLITADGVIIPNQKYKIETLKYEKRKSLYDFLAKSMIQNASLKESSWNKNLYDYLEDISKMQVVENIKGNKKKSNQNSSLNKVKSTVVPISYSTVHDFTSMQKKCSMSNLPRSALTSAEYSLTNSRFFQTNVTKLKRCYSAKETSPYILPLLWCNSDKNQNSFSIHNAIKSVKRKKRKQIQSSLNPEQKLNNASSKLSSTFKNIASEQCKITLFYHGHGVISLQSYLRKEIVIKQQHCGGTSVTAFKGDIVPNETVTFISLTHDGFPFNVTIFLDGIRDLKLSSCCVFRYTLKKRLGGSTGNFSLQNIIGGNKCLKCQYLEVGASNNLKRKTIGSDINASHTDNHQEKHLSAVIENTGGKNNPDTEKNISPRESVVESTKSDVSTKYDEEIEENLTEKLDAQNSESDTQIPENRSEKSEIESIGESNYDSDSSIKSYDESIQEEVNKAKLPVTNNYQSESSSEDENGIEHVVLASVHRTPT